MVEVSSRPIDAPGRDYVRLLVLLTRAEAQALIVRLEPTTLTTATDVTFAVRALAKIQHALMEAAR
jgi:hypothetical protein